MPDKPVKISEETETKLIALKHKLENEGVPYFKRTRKHLIGVSVDKAELIDEAIFCLEQLIMSLPANKDWLCPSIERRAKEAISQAEAFK